MDSDRHLDAIMAGALGGRMPQDHQDINMDGSTFLNQWMLDSPTYSYSTSLDNAYNVSEAIASPAPAHGMAYGVMSHEGKRSLSASPASPMDPPQLICSSIPPANGLQIIKTEAAFDDPSAETLCMSIPSLTLT